MRFRRSKNERGRGKNIQRYLLYGLCAVSAVACAALGLFVYAARADLRATANAALARFLDHPYFSVREIKVNAGPETGGSEIVALAGLTHGTSLWRVDPTRIERKISGHPSVRHVVARREFPHRVVIEIAERAPRGIVALDRLYYVDAEGVIFKEISAGEKSDFPFLTGLQASDLKSRATPERIREALALHELVKEVLPVSEIHFPKGGGLVLYPAAYPVPILLGWGEWRAKLRRLEWVLAEWRGREKKLAALDLRFRGQVVAKLKNDES